MKVLWAKSPQTAVEVVQALEQTEDWHPNTIKTLLTRLCRKGAVGVNKHKSLYEYRPLFTEAEEGIPAAREPVLDAGKSLSQGGAERVPQRNDAESGFSAAGDFGVGILGRALKLRNGRPAQILQLLEGALADFGPLGPKLLDPFLRRSLGEEEDQQQTSHCLTYTARRPTL